MLLFTFRLMRWKLDSCTVQIRLLIEIVYNNIYYMYIYTQGVSFIAERLQLILLPPLLIQFCSSVHKSLCIIMRNRIRGRS